MQIKKLTYENEMYRKRELQWLDDNGLDASFLLQKDDCEVV
jgi:hypothetical protein